MRVRNNIEKSIEKLSDFINEKLESKETILKLDDEMTKEDKQNPKVISANKALKMVNQISNIYIKMEKEKRAQKKAGKERVQEAMEEPGIKQTLSVVEHIEGINKNIIINKFIPEVLISSSKEEYWNNLKKIFNFEEKIKALMDACSGVKIYPPKSRKVRRAEEKQRLKELDGYAQEIFEQHGRTLSESVRNKLDWVMMEMVMV